MSLLGLQPADLCLQTLTLLHNLITLSTGAVELLLQHSLGAVEARNLACGSSSSQGGCSSLLCVCLQCVRLVSSSKPPLCLLSSCCSQDAANLLGLTLGHCRSQHRRLPAELLLQLLPGCCFPL